MAFELHKCKGPQGLPLLEVPGGPYVFERLTPGEIREADYYEEFRWGKGGDMLFACPRGKTKKGRCSEPLRLLRVRHKRASLPGLLKDCKSGSLYDRRKSTISRILKDIEKKHSKSGKTMLGWFESAKTAGGKIMQAVGVAVLIGLMGMAAVRLLSPVMGGQPDVR